MGILGCGAWASTVAKIIAENGHSVLMWCHDTINRDEINEFKTRKKIFGNNFKFPESLTSTTSYENLLNHSDCLIIGIASPYISSIKNISKIIKPDLPVLSLTKGLVKDKEAFLMSAYLEKMLPKASLAILSGPNLAMEIKDKKPSATVIASHSEKTASLFQSIISNTYFRAYSSNDVIGVQLGGILKNIIAIAAGCSDGLQYGANAKATLLSRGLKEMVDFACKLGANKQTLYGLSGMGDLVATSHSETSRNWQVGHALATGKTLVHILETAKAVAEGVNTTEIIYSKNKELNVEMPITHEIYQLLFEKKSPQAALEALMTRKLKSEF